MDQIASGLFELTLRTHSEHNIFSMCRLWATDVPVRRGTGESKRLILLLFSSTPTEVQFWTDGDKNACQVADLAGVFLVAAVGFEPMTFRL